MEQLFRNVRESATPAIWSKGVELSRLDAVTGDSETIDEITLRVQSKEAAISQTVVLYPLDGDWSCGCGGDDDPCAHVAAAVISLKRAREQGTALPKPKAGAGRLVYQFRRSPTGLQFERVVEDGEKSATLTVALTALASGRVAGPAVAATAEDLDVDLALGNQRRGTLPATVFPKLLKALTRVDDVTLDGAPIKIDPEPVGLVVEVKDEGPGVRVAGRQDPAIREAFANGVALCDSGLRPIVMPTLSSDQQKLVREGRYFGPRDFAELVSTILPALEQRLPVRTEARQLPRRQNSKPRLELTLEPVQGQLTVTPAIVYGDPVEARLVAGRFEVVGTSVPARDFDAERRLADDLSRELRLGLDQRMSLPAAEAVRLVERLGRFPGDLRGSGASHFVLYQSLEPRLAIEGTDLSLRFDAAADGALRPAREADALAVFAAFRAGESLVPLLGGGFAPLPEAWLTRYGSRVADLLAARDATKKLPRSALLELAALAEDSGLPVPAALADLKKRLGNFQELPPFKPEPGLTATLRPYQQDGVRWLSFLRDHELGALLADDMGLGKTIQTLAVLKGRTLIVAPTSVLFNWLNELKRFRPDLEWSSYHGPGRVLDAKAKVVITTYAILRLDNDALAAANWDNLILDEAQAIKNSTSQVWRAAVRVPARFRVALSGTPVENRLEELWSLMQFVNPGLLGDLSGFQDRYARRIGNADAGAAARLRSLIRPFVLRRLKRDVAPDLPPRTDVGRHVELSKEERATYDVVRAAARRDVVDRIGQGATMLEALEALLRLRQACCHPGLLPGNAGEGPSAKLTLLVELLLEAHAEGHKTLVYSQWTSLLDLAEPALVAAGLPFLRLDGSTTDRAGVVAGFQSASGPPVLLLSLKAGGVGLNLTAADHVVILDPWWNPAAEDQAADRAHRIGQNKPVLVQRLVALETVEERILNLQEIKRGLAAAAFGEGAGANLTRDDILALLD